MSERVKIGDEVRTYVFSNEPKVVLDLSAIACASGEWQTWTWDRKKWEVQVERELCIDWAQHHKYVMEHQQRLHELAIEDFRDNVAGRGKWKR